MLEELIVHIGIHKTGSSSIQESLKGYFDGNTAYANFIEANHSAPLYTVFSKYFLTYHAWVKAGLSEEEILNKREKYKLILERELSRTDITRLILSAEDLSVLSENDKNDMLEFLKQFAKKLVVIAYVREPISFITSDLQERIKGGASSFPVNILPNYRDRLEPYRINPLVDDFLVIDFSKENLYLGDVVEDFISRVKIDSSKIKKISSNFSYSLDALKIVYFLNSSNPCNFGDAIMLDARQNFIQKIAYMYPGDTIKKDIFFDLVDIEDCEYLSSQYFIDYKINNKDNDFNETKSDKKIISILSDLSDITAEPLYKELNSLGIKGDFGTIEKAIYRLFYHFLFTSSMKIYSALLDEDATKLKDLALYYEEKKNLNKSDALYLMGLAKKIRPNGPFINSKIEEWGS